MGWIPGWVTPKSIKMGAISSSWHSVFGVGPWRLDHPMIAERIRFTSFALRKKLQSWYSATQSITDVILPAQAFPVLFTSPSWVDFQSGERLKCNLVE